MLAWMDAAGYGMDGPMVARTTGWLADATRVCVVRESNKILFEKFAFDYYTFCNVGNTGNTPFPLKVQNVIVQAPARDYCQQ